MFFPYKHPQRSTFGVFSPPWERRKRSKKVKCETGKKSKKIVFSPSPQYKSLCDYTLRLQAVPNPHPHGGTIISHIFHRLESFASVLWHRELLKPCRSWPHSFIKLDKVLAGLGKVSTLWKESLVWYLPPPVIPYSPLFMPPSNSLSCCFLYI
jgi:hypothetical protein